jgi:acyl-CoA ligase (AMP-forming) (exosortase A-associated)
MRAKFLLQHLILASAERTPDAPALTFGSVTRCYRDLADDVEGFATGLRRLGVQRADRIGVYLDKRPETITAMFGAAAASAVFVPINPVLKAPQVAYILRDCNVRVLVTSAERLATLGDVLPTCSDLSHVVITPQSEGSPPKEAGDVAVHAWSEIRRDSGASLPRSIDSDMAAILYTSGSTGSPKGVVLSHRNMVTGATSVATYLENSPADTILAALPLSFDAGFSQLTTAFHAGARVVLHDYLLPRDALKLMAAERVTGLTAVPPLWIQLTQLAWPDAIGESLRYIANTGGRMPLETLKALRARLPRTQVYLMYGLTEAFRATYLDPREVERRPDSIGKAIPNAEILVLRDDGTPCEPNEPGELVQRGALVAMGYWDDAEKTAERFKPLPGGTPTHPDGIVLPETAVFSGDTVRMDEDGFLYFIGRRDEMIKTSGYRVSPTEVEEVLYATKLVAECVAFGLSHASLGEGICVVANAREGDVIDVQSLLGECRTRMPAYMVPTRIEPWSGPLPRNANGKIDRKALKALFASRA